MNEQEAQATNQELDWTAGDCTFPGTTQRSNGGNYYPHDFHIAMNDRGAMLVCAKCGESYILGTDRQWHQFGYGRTIPDLVESGDIPPLDE